MKSACSALCCLLLLCGYGQAQVTVAGEPGSQLQLESDYVPLAIRLEGDALNREIRSVRIVGSVPAEGDGAAEIWLDGRSAELNAFGDVVQRVGPEQTPIPVELRYVDPSPGQVTDQPSVAGIRSLRSRASLGFRVYELVFPGGELEGRMKLVLGTTNRGPHRLLVYGTTSSGSGPYPEKLGQTLPLHGVPSITSVLPDAPLRSHVRLSGWYTAVDGRIHRLEVNGTLGGGEGTLVFDPNHITFDFFGEPVLSTAMAYQRDKIALQPAEVDDPLEQGRRCYRAIRKEPRNTYRNNYRVTVVLGRTEASPHRMLLYDGDELAFIVPAWLPDRREQEIAAWELTSASAGEQQAMADLRQAVGHGFRTEIENGHVVGLQFRGNRGGVLSDGVLSRLPHLRSIQFGVGCFPATGLADLQHLGQLRSLFFDNTEFKAEGLACLENLTQLESLSFYDCRGINDEGVKHLAGLTGLKRLSFYSERRLRRPPDAGSCITDAGVAHLKGLVLLERLSFEGHDLSNASMPILAGMRELQELALSGRGLTDAGLEGLTGLAKLRSLRLIDTAVTKNGVAKLKARSPGLRVEAWTHDQEQG